MTAVSMTSLTHFLQYIIFLYFNTVWEGIYIYMFMETKLYSYFRVLLQNLLLFFSVFLIFHLLQSLQSLTHFD